MNRKSQVRVSGNQPRQTLTRNHWRRRLSSSHRQSRITFIQRCKICWRKSSATFFFSNWIAVYCSLPLTLRAAKWPQIGPSFLFVPSVAFVARARDEKKKFRQKFCLISLRQSSGEGGKELRRRQELARPKTFTIQRISRRMEPRAQSCETPLCFKLFSWLPLCCPQMFRRMLQEKMFLSSSKNNIAPIDEKEKSLQK